MESCAARSHCSSWARRASDAAVPRRARDNAAAQRPVMKFGYSSARGSARGPQMNRASTRCHRERQAGQSFEPRYARNAARSLAFDLWSSRSKRQNAKAAVVRHHPRSARMSGPLRLGQSARRASQQRCGLTRRSCGPAPAWHLAREAVWCIICRAGQAPRRCGPLNSNVRPHRAPPPEAVRYVDQVSWWRASRAKA